MIVHYHSLVDKGDVLPNLWHVLRNDDPPPWMWGNYAPLTLTEFVLYFSEPTRHLFITITPDETEFTGMLWVDEMILGQRARAHFYFFRKHRKRKSTQIKKTFTEMLKVVADPPFNLQTLIYVADTRATDAIHIAERFGGTFIGEIPGYYPGEYPVRIGYFQLKGLQNAISIRPPIGWGIHEHGNHGAGGANDGHEGPQHNDPLPAAPQRAA